MQVSEARKNTTDRCVAIIGAGPSGMAAAEALQRMEIDFHIFEKSESIGGIWDISRPITPIYDTTHFISSRQVSGFEGFPMPLNYPDYPSHRLILRYLKDYFQTIGVGQRISLGCEVVKVLRHKNKWLIKEKSGAERLFSSVIVATGHHWIPNYSTIPGEFHGLKFHSMEYFSPKYFVGKKY